MAYHQEGQPRTAPEVHSRQRVGLHRGVEARPPRHGLDDARQCRRLGFSLRGVFFVLPPSLSSTLVTCMRCALLTTIAFWSAEEQRMRCINNWGKDETGCLQDPSGSPSLYHSPIFWSLHWYQGSQGSSPSTEVAEGDYPRQPVAFLHFPTLL